MSFDSDRMPAVARLGTGQAAPLRAVLVMIAAGGSFCMLDSSAKYLVTAGYRAEFVTWVRFLIHVPLVLIAFRAWHNPGPFRVRSLPLQVCRGLALLGATLLNFSALRTLQLDQAVVIGFLAPVVITALSGPLLREWPGWRRWLAVFAGLAGVLVIVRPGFGGFQIGHLYALGAMVSMSLYTLMTRYLGASETTQSLTLFPALTAVLLLLPMVLPFAEVPHDPVELTLLLGLGLWGALGHYLVVCGHKMATAAALAPYPYLGIVWAIGSGYVVFGQLPDQWTLAGAAIIIGGALYVMGREHQLRERNGQ